MIYIHWDFTNSTEVSYQEGLELKDNFNTHCLDFFNMDIDVDDVIVVNKEGLSISRKNIQNHTNKKIRKSHNIHKMLIAGSFDWKFYWE